MHFKPYSHILLATLLAFIVGCNPSPQSRKPQTTTTEITGSKAERVAAVSKLIRSNSDTLPEILDARLIEIKIGDGQLGPADYQSFIWLKLSPDDAKAWSANLSSPPDTTPLYSSPPGNAEWWLTEEAFDELKKYDARASFSRLGWIVVDESGNVFAMTFTN